MCVCVCGIKMRWVIRRQAGKGEGGATKEIYIEERSKQREREQQQSLFRTLPLEFPFRIPSRRTLLASKYAMANGACDNAANADQVVVWFTV